ncbi:MAG: DUF4625 domain-containing protein [Chitinophagaceae bacterium]
MIKYFLLLLSTISLLSCSKNNGKTDDKVLPVITLSSPTNGQTFTAGTTINIVAAISDNNKLAEIHVHISNNATGQLVADIHRYPNASVYTLNETFQVQAGINYTIRVLAIDTSGNHETQTVTILVN